MSITEPNFATGALNLMPIKKRKQKHDHVEVGKTYECDLTKTSIMWNYPFIAEVQCLNEKSAVVKIITTHVLDDKMIVKLGHQTVVPFKYMQLLD